MITHIYFISDLFSYVRTHSHQHLFYDVHVNVHTYSAKQLVRLHHTIWWPLRNFLSFDETLVLVVSCGKNATYAYIEPSQASTYQPYF